MKLNHLPYPVAPDDRPLINRQAPRFAWRYNPVEEMRHIGDLNWRSKNPAVSPRSESFRGLFTAGTGVMLFRGECG
jgi:hypothetical protein